MKNKSDNNSVLSSKFVTFKDKIDNYFGITRNASTFKIETIGGLTTFFAMMYILLINPATTLGDKVDKRLSSAIYIGTALGALLGTLLYSLYAKMPFAQASGMGLNSFFYVSFMLSAENAAFDQQLAQYSKGLTTIFISGIIFIIISATGIRKKIVESMPDNLKKAIPAGIGLFIAFVGLKTANVVSPNKYTIIQLTDINVLNPNGMTPLKLWYDKLAPILIMIISLVLLGLLSKKKLKGAVIYTIASATILYYLFNINNSQVFTSIQQNYKEFLPQKTFENFGKYSIGQTFFGFTDVFQDANGQYTFASIMNIVMLVLTFLLVDMFDTLGTLQGTATEAGMLDSRGLPIRLKQSLMADSIGTLGGSILGVSSVTTFVESSAGVAAGARTGFASLVTACGFFIALFFSPIAAVVPAVATAPILVYVGVLMLKNFKFVDMSDITEAIPAFLTLLMMPLTYSISNGIAVGLITYTLLKLVTLKFKKKDIIPAIIAILFIIRFLTVTM